MWIFSYIFFGPINTQTLVLPIKDIDSRVKVAPLVKVGSKPQKARNSKRIIFKSCTNHIHRMT